METYEVKFPEKISALMWKILWGWLCDECFCDRLGYLCLPGQLFIACFCLWLIITMTIGKLFYDNKSEKSNKMECP